MEYEKSSRQALFLQRTADFAVLACRLTKVISASAIKSTDNIRKCYCTIFPEIKHFGRVQDVFFSSPFSFINGQLLLSESWPCQKHPLKNTNGPQRVLSFRDSFLPAISQRREVRAAVREAHQSPQGGNCAGTRDSAAGLSRKQGSSETY